MNEELATLYHRGKKGSVYSWRVWTEGPDIVTEYGLVDGEKQLARKTATPKNVGRSNQTTDVQQAGIEAQAMWQKKRDQKYAESIEEAHKELIRPMRAKDFEKRKGLKKNGVTYPVYTQPKLDGVRALAFWDEDRNRWELMSRSGKSWRDVSDNSVNHITAGLHLFTAAYPELKRFAIDGEIYAHGESFQQTTRLIKKYRPGESERLVFHVYDLIDREDMEVGFEGRIQNLFWFRDRLTPRTPIETVETDLALDEDEVYKHQMTYVADGYEGAMVRLGDGGYQWGAQSHHLLKVKSFQDAEYPIERVLEGVGKFEGCAIFECRTEQGHLFRVTPMGTMEERADMYAHSGNYIGKQLKVKFFETTEDGIPRFPIGLGVRAEEDMGG